MEFCQESCDGKALHAFASRVPAVRKSADAFMMQRKTLQRNAAVKVVDALMNSPNLFQDRWGNMEAVLKTRKEDQEDDAKSL